MHVLALHLPSINVPAYTNATRCLQALLLFADLSPFVTSRGEEPPSAGGCAGTAFTCRKERIVMAGIEQHA